MFPLDFLSSSLALMLAGGLAVSGSSVPVEEVEETGYIFIGDSRTVGMDRYMDISSNEDCFVVAKVGQGYKWLTKTALDEVASIKSEHLDIDNWVEIYLLGVNDLGNIQSYIETYESFSDDSSIVLVSVNPVEYHNYITNDMIENFNSKLQDTDYDYIDTYSQIKDSYSSVDGVHYTKETYADIWRIIEEELDMP